MKKPKGLKKMFEALISFFDGDEYRAGLFFAVILDMLGGFVKDGPRELRTMRFELNGFFSITYDFEKDMVVEE